MGIHIQPKGARVTNFIIRWSLVCVIDGFFEVQFAIPYHLYLEFRRGFVCVSGKFLSESDDYSLHYFLAVGLKHCISVKKIALIR